MRKLRNAPKARVPVGQASGLSGPSEAYRAT
jgi:hypothetical protein